MAILIEGCWDDKSRAKFRHFYVVLVTHLEIIKSISHMCYAYP